MACAGMAPNLVTESVEGSRRMLLMDLNEQADKDFGLARRKAWIRNIALRLRGKSAGDGATASFQNVQNALRAHNRVRRGIRVVDTDRIVGSVGRSKDFDRRFLPLRASTGERWKPRLRNSCPRAPKMPASRRNRK